VEDDVVRYVATSKNVQVDIASGSDCTVTVNSIEPNDGNFLVVNYSAEPAIYSGTFFADVSYTTSCPNSSYTSSDLSPIMYPTLDAQVSSDSKLFQEFMKIFHQNTRVPGILWPCRVQTHKGSLEYARGPPRRDV
jgi:hypothetical protein